MLCLPPHTTHKIQPLGRTLFKPLQTYYDQAGDRWLRTHVGRVITPYQLCGLFNQAYCKASTMSTAINGFARCGIWPCSRDVFAESEFHASFSNTRDQSTSFAEAPSTGTTSHHNDFADSRNTHSPDHCADSRSIHSPVHCADSRSTHSPEDSADRRSTHSPVHCADSRSTHSPVHCADSRRAHSSVICAHSRNTNSPVRRAAPTTGASSEQCAFGSIGTQSQPASTPTQATDQHYTTAPLSETIDLSPCVGRSVYSTKPDGRCFSGALSSLLSQLYRWTETTDPSPAPS